MVERREGVGKSSVFILQTVESCCTIKSRVSPSHLYFYQMSLAGYVVYKFKKDKKWKDKEDLGNWWKNSRHKI